MHSKQRWICSLLALSIALPACLAETGDGDELDPELSEIDTEIGVYQWANDTQIADKFSARPVALAPFNNRLYMAYTDHSNISTSEILFAWWDGIAWSTSLTTGKWTTTRPALTTYNNRLTMIYRPSGETGLRMTSTANLTWSSPVAAGRSLAIGNYAASWPSATVIGGNLYATYCVHNGTSSYVNVDKYDGASWSAFKQVPVSYASSVKCNSALLAAMPEGGVEIIFTTSNSVSQVEGGDVYRVRGTIGRSSTVWYATEALPMQSLKPVSVVSCNGITHLVHGGHSYDTRIAWSYRVNGDWSNDVDVPDQWSSAGPALGCLNDTTTLMVHNSSGGTNALMKSIYAP